MNIDKQIKEFTEVLLKMKKVNSVEFTVRCKEGLTYTIKKHKTIGGN